MATLLIIHWSVRWLIVLVAGSMLGRFLVGWRRGKRFDPIDEMLLGSFKKLMIVQVLLGAALFFFSPSQNGNISLRLMHAGIMLVALGVAHLPARWKEAEVQTRYRNALLCVLGALALIVVGVGIFPGGWRV